jgi:hypothetical protein
MDNWITHPAFKMLAGDEGWGWCSELRRLSMASRTRTRKKEFQPAQQQVKVVAGGGQDGVHLVVAEAL